MKKEESILQRHRRLAVLKAVLLNEGCTRKQAAQIADLDKNTTNQIITEWCDADILTEKPLAVKESSSSGRPASGLFVSDAAPCICGMLIKRNQLSVVIGKLNGRIAAQESMVYDTITEETLIGNLCLMYRRAEASVGKKILGIGIASIGPTDTIAQTISPQYFFNITNFPVCRYISEKLGIPSFLINDVNAGALAELYWGNGKAFDNFIYLHVMNGIGIGPVLNGTLYNGDSGQSGEIGHTSINQFGPLCECGNHGCLDLYTNKEAWNRSIYDMQKCGIPTILPPVSFPDALCSWTDLILACGKNDSVAIHTISEFSSYLSGALINMIRLFDVNTLIIGYECADDNTVFETIVASRLNQTDNGNRTVKIMKSKFLDSAPLYGSMALICSLILSGKLSLAENE